MKRSFILTLSVAATLGAPAARAEGSDPVAAQALFDEGMQLMKSGKAAEACPKFLRSYEHEKASGTAYKLAVCYEQTGQLASAWARYVEAEAGSRAAGKAEREQASREGAARLKPMLAWLSVAGPPALVGLEVKRDGKVVDPGDFGTLLPVDPGKHVIEASAPGKKPWKKEIEIPSGPGKFPIEVPALEDAPAGAPAGPIAPPPAVATRAPAGDQAAKASAFPRRPVGFALIAAGGAGVIAGAITGGLAVSRHAGLASSCTAGTCVNQGSAISSYHTLATVADVGLFAGGALAVTGIVLVVTAPSTPPAKQAWVQPVLGPGFSGIMGRF